MLKVNKMNRQSNPLPGHFTHRVPSLCLNPPPPNTPPVLSKSGSCRKQLHVLYVSYNSCPDYVINSRNTEKITI